MTQLGASSESTPPLPVEDDRVIGRALWWSVGIALGIAVITWRSWSSSASTRTPPLSNLPPVVVVPKETAGSTVSLPNVPFTDVTQSAGISFVHNNGATGESLLPEAMGSGCAFFDYDADGDPDLLLVNGQRRPPVEDPSPPMALYENDGSGRFTDVTASVGLDIAFDGMGVAAGDYDNDGFVDLYVTALGSNRLFHNVAGKFVDVTATAGVAGTEPVWSTGCCWFDYDRDGDLDLFVGRYLAWSAAVDRQLDSRLNGTQRSYGPPDLFEGLQPILYRNDGEGRFTDVTKSAGMEVWNPDSGLAVPKILSVQPVDIDSDGWLDLIAVCDGVQNLVYRNQRDGTFREIGIASGLGLDRYGLAKRGTGLDAARLDHDGRWTIAVGRVANEVKSLYREQPVSHGFSDEGLSTGFGPAARQFLTFGLCFVDVDLDGQLDLLTANGQIQPDFVELQASQTHAQPPQLLWNHSAAEKTAFIPLSALELGTDFALPLVGRGATCADIDGDGDLDLLLTANGGAPRLLRNDQQLGHHWLRLNLRGTVSPRDAIGAVVDVEAGDMKLQRTVMPTVGYLSQRELPLTIGVGTHNRIDRLRVTWPDGSAQTQTDVAVNQSLVIEQQSDAP